MSSCTVQSKKALGFANAMVVSSHLLRMCILYGQPGECRYLLSPRSYPARFETKRGIAFLDQEWLALLFSSPTVSLVLEYLYARDVRRLNRRGLRRGLMRVPSGCDTLGSIIPVLVQRATTSDNTQVLVEPRVANTVSQRGLTALEVQTLLPLSLF
ncbi:hypothetical protein B9Z19DRAFT_331580 [Tuber borchii]|uniref:Uncharacterized protein n=1 Tax=Tuber borchii TaxID=42251 RepID=A0A2T6ZJE8_TUBBO|nr:hypothetical protein B9Z19DRAFT_331580 [Tuber borchii]